MDIQVSSNFERLLFDLYDREGSAVSQLMDDLNSKGAFALSQGALDRLRGEFDSANCSEEETSATIRFAQDHYNEIVCPHTAIAIKAAAEMRGDPATPMITLATAHAAKFPDAVEAACGVRPDLPPHMAGLFDRDERVTRVANDLSAIKDIIRKGITA
jgi:threonine synthase